MLIPPKYTHTNKISELLTQIEAAKAVIEAITIPPEIEMNIRRRSTLKSALFSARIEGSELTEEDLTSSHTQKKAEVFNILKATNWLFTKKNKDISVNDLLTLHTMTMNGLIETSNLGKFRTEVSAIFNSAGIAIYMPPPPRYVQTYIEKLLTFVHGSKERFAPIKAALAHFTFEKIHPFLDGNGRVGRLFFHKILMQSGYGMKGLLTIEEYLDNHRSEYYRALEEPEKELSDYVEFMLGALSYTAQEAQKLVTQKQKADITDYLLPRRAEIYQLIKEQQLVNFDMLRRRFLKVNERTLRYDLLKLQEQGLIRKRGTTKGVYYESQEK